MPDALQGRARYRRILRFAAWNLAVTWWYDILLPTIGLRRIADRTRDARMQKFARKFRAMAIELGGLMIKVGQFMSSRLDVLPPSLTKELEGLQDEVPAVPFAAIRDLAEAQLGVPLARAFASVEEVPVAAASLGQAHRAVLGEADAEVAGFSQVVLKVQRPGIADIVAVDFAALRRVARWLSRLRVVSDRADMPALIEQFGRTSMQEIDYLHEAASAEQFAENFADNAQVRAPQVVWERTTREVLTLEDVTAIKITDHTRLREAGIDPSEVADAFARAMFDQLFVHGLVHADPHPGNLFVTPLPEATGDGPRWAITFIDFGMMGEVPSSLRGTLRKLLIAAAGRDGRGLVEAMKEADVLLPTANLTELERVMTQLFARFGGMGFAELREVDPREFRDFANEFGDVLLEMPFQLPKDFLLIIRAVSLTSGVCSSLDPQFNVWNSAEPYAEKMLRDESGNVVSDFAREAVDIAGVAWRLPKRMDSVLDRLDNGTLKVSTPKLEATASRIERTARRLLSAIVFAGLLMAGALIRGNDLWLSNALMIASLVPLFHVVFGARRPR